MKSAPPMNTNAKFRLIRGVGRSSRSEKIDILVKETWPRVCLLLPTQAAARTRREKLFLEDDLPGALGLRVTSLMEFTEALLSQQGLHVRRLDDLERRFLLRGILDELGRAHPEHEHLVQHKDHGGFVNHLLRVITDLKQAAVEPHQFKEALGRMSAALSAFDDIVVEAYQAYQEHLQSHRRYDVPGVYWEAFHVCAQTKPTILEDIDTIALDCFDDFTPSELRFLKALSGHLQTMALGLHFDEAPGRSDLFALPRKTIERLRRDFHFAQEHCETPSPATQVEFAADNLFWREKPCASEALRANLTVQPCLNPTHEIEWIGRDIKQTITREGVSPSDIAVVFRQPANAAKTLTATFAEYGIPLNLPQDTPLAEHVLGMLIGSLFEVRKHWRRNDVLHVITSPYCTALADQQARPNAFAHLCLHSQILEGHAEWKHKLETLEKRLSPARDESSVRLITHIPDALLQIEFMQKRCNSLRELLDSLPDTATMREHLSAIELLLRTLGVSNALAAESTHIQALAVWQRLQQVCATSYHATERVSRSEFETRLLSGLAEATFPELNNTQGVKCLGPELLRGQSFKRVYLANLMEGVFPTSSPLNAFYGEDERDALRKKGVELDRATDHGERERLLLHHVLEAAHEALTITWPMLKADGRESARSPFLAEILEIFGEDSGILRPAPQADGFLPQPQYASSLRELSQAAFYSAASWKVRFAPELKPALAAAQLEGQRDLLGAFNRADACMGSAEIQKELQAEYGEDYVFSPTQLETWLGCPFRFWTKYVLKIEEAEEAEMEFDPRVRGIIIHAILESFHQYFKGVAVVDIPEAEGVEALEKFTEEVFVQQGWKSSNASESIQRLEKARILKQLKRYLTIQRVKDKANWKPAHFESSFGMPQKKVSGQLHVDAPLVLELPSGSVKLSGRIDRIDVSANSCRIVDYKSGGIPKAGEISGGAVVQLHVYKWAVENLLLPESECVQADYISIRNGEILEALKCVKPDKCAERESAVQNGIMSALAGIRGGAFAPLRRGDTCMGCALLRACRYDENRMKRKADSTPLLCALGTGGDAEEEE